MDFDYVFCGNIPLEIQDNVKEYCEKFCDLVMPDEADLKILEKRNNLKQPLTFSDGKLFIGDTPVFAFSTVYTVVYLDEQKRTTDGTVQAILEISFAPSVAFYYQNDLAAVGSIQFYFTERHTLAVPLSQLPTPPWCTDHIIHWYTKDQAIKAIDAEIERLTKFKNKLIGEEP